MTTLLRRFALLLFLSLCVHLAHAQLSTASLFGTITDSGGAVIPKASIVITQTQTGFTRTLTTKENGEYRADFLPIGPYKLSVSAPGFSTLDREGIVLTVTEDAKLDLALKPGATTQTVEVTADVPLLNTGNSTLGRTVSNVEIDNLPLVDRNVYTLLDLTPGVQNNNAAGTGANGGVINPLGYPEQHVKINGSSDSGVGQVAYYLDGGSNMTGVRNTGNPLPNPDAIQEFSVQTNNFSAQFGRNSAGVVAVVTKSGSNKFHGSAFEFFRDRNFNATEHLLAQKTPYNQHRFGGTVGGPVLHDKLFFFGSYGGFRYISANNFVTTVPSAAMDNGNFSENMPTGVAPSDATKCTVAAQSSTRFWACNPYLPKATAWCPGNICGTSVFDPSIEAILKAGLIPTPNPSSVADSIYTRRDLSPFRQRTDEQLGKVDYNYTARQRLTLSYFHQTGDYVVNPSGNNILGWVVHDYKFNQHDANVQHTWTLSNSTVNQLYLNYTRLIGGRVPSPAQTLADFGSTFAEQNINGGICTAGQTGCSRPQLGVSGWFTAGNAITGPVTGTNEYAIRDIVSSTHGKHTLYYGGEGDRENDAQQTTLNDYGVFSFSSYTGTIPANRAAASINNFFFGSPNSMEQDVPVYANANYFNYGLFLQDDWRVLSNLTVNLGIRYDIQTTPTDTLRETMQFVPGVQSTVAPSLPLGVLLPGDNGVPAGGVANRYDHVSPRVGFAYTPYSNGHTVIHGAAGLFYGSVGGNLFTYPSNGEPFSGRPTFSNVIHVNSPYASDPKDFCGGVVGCTVGTSPFPFVYNPAKPQFVVTPAALIPIDPNFHWPLSYQINFGFQQQLGNSFQFGATYVGSLNRKLPIEWDINYPTFNITAAGTSGASCTNTALNCAYTNTTANLNARRPFNDGSYHATATSSAANPQYSTISQIQSSESANYNALQVTAQQRITHGFSIQGFYVWSKDIQSEDLDTPGNTGNSAGTEPEDNHFKYLDRQRADYDQRHLAVITFVYKPNYGFTNRFARYAVNGWTVTSIIRMQSGLPFNITTGGDTNADGVSSDRPNPAPGVVAHVNNNGTSRVAAEQNWVNEGQFCIYNAATTLDAAGDTNPACAQNGAGPLGSDGTLRQNTLNAPGRRSVDASLFRDFPLYRDRVRFQLRGEATNVFNLTNLPAPNSTLSSGYATFGHITGTIQGGSFSNRIIQVGGRILF